MKSPLNKRKHRDIMKLMMSDYKVERVQRNDDEFFVTFHGPKETPYEDGLWKVRVALPSEYPFCSPSIGFKNKIYHPNVDLRSGTVCLDVINQTWSPMYDLLNIFEVFLPQLLTYPNPSDPLNAEAASLLLQSEEDYEEKVRDLVDRYASNPKRKKIEKVGVEKNKNHPRFNSLMTVSTNASTDVEVDCAMEENSTNSKPTSVRNEGMECILEVEGEIEDPSFDFEF
eukprot:maker-scaffold_3-snap-gene-9.48-mRNA-1 protein AED:0.04 eAED:0.04 QI:99/1/1/1/1/1/3/158/226